MSYDPRAFGADCDRCPLRDIRAGGPVPPEARNGALALLIGEAPGKEEAENGRPFIGAAGVELWRALGSLGYKRDRFSITNALLCRPPENKLDRVLKSVAKENKARAAAKMPLIPSPLQCCAPRLYREIHALPHVVTLGAIALHVVTGRATSIMEARGGPLEMFGGRLRVLPALHPAFVMRAKRWRAAFRADLGRALRWFSSGLAWRDPEILFQPSPEALVNFLRSEPVEGFRVFDVETGMAYPVAELYEPTRDPLKLIGIGDSRRVVSITLIDRGDGTIIPYDAATKERIRTILGSWISSKHRKAGWNSGYYDRMVVEAQLPGAKLAAHLDGIGLHKMAEPELPHNLGYAGSIYTDIHAWKAGKPVEGDTQTDRERAIYNARDVSVTHLCIPTLAKAVEARRQSRAAAFFPFVQDVCVGLHRNGMYVDHAKRLEWDRKLWMEAQERMREIRELAGRPHMNPGSFPQVADLLFNEWGFLPHHYSETTGEPSTDDESLRYYMTKAPATEGQRRCIAALRRFRVAVKLRGTYVRKIRPVEEEPLAIDPFAFDEDAWTAMKRGEKVATAGLCQPDGRIHPDYLPHGTVGWRLSSSNPNAQNFTDRLRDMIIPAPGNVFVGCDQAQLELRMVAGLAHDQPYLDAFEKDEDPHKELCIDFFGKHFLDAPKVKQKELRVFVKQGTYASLYLANVETIHDQLASSEDRETGELVYANLDPRQTMLFHEKWKARHPAIVQWWEDVITTWRKQGFLEEPVFGLRCDFLDGEEPNKLVNLQPQSGGSAIVHLATKRLLEEIPFEKWGPGTGLVQQGHDALVVECPEAEAERVKAILERCMTFSAREAAQWGLPLKFLGEGKIGKNWKEV